MNQSRPHPKVRPEWGCQMSGGGWDGHAATRQVPSVGTRNRVDGGDAGGQQHGQQDHQEDQGGHKHGSTVFSVVLMLLAHLLIQD